MERKVQEVAPLGRDRPLEGSSVRRSRRQRSQPLSRRVAVSSAARDRRLARCSGDHSRNPSLQRQKKPEQHKHQPLCSGQRPQGPRCSARSRTLTHRALQKQLVASKSRSGLCLAKLLRILFSEASKTQPSPQKGSLSSVNQQLLRSPPVPNRRSPRPRKHQLPAARA